MKKNDATLSPKILVINSTDRQRIELALVIPEKTFQLSKEVRAQELAELIEELLKEAAINSQDLTAIAVCQKAGSLTGTRMGVTAANTLAWLYNLPIFGLESDNIQDALEEIKAVKLKPQKQAKVTNEVVY